MENERLRRAMEARRFTVTDLADAVGVDPKTVQRWLRGSVPHPRHRWAVAEILGEHESSLWPIQGRARPAASATDEVVETYAHRADTPADVWWRTISAASQEISLLGYAMLHLPEQHAQLMPTLREKGSAGCRIRIALVDPDSEEAHRRDAEEQLNGGLVARIRTASFYFADLLGNEGIELRFHATPMYNSVFRFDSQMFVTPHLYGTHGAKAPLMHLLRRSDNGIFERFMHHFNAVWDEAKPFEDRR